MSKEIEKAYQELEEVEELLATLDNTAAEIMDAVALARATYEVTLATNTAGRATARPWAPIADSTQRTAALVAQRFAAPAKRM